MPLTAAAAIVLAIGQLATSDLQVFGLGAVHWHDRQDALLRVLPRWRPTTRHDGLGRLLVPGEVAEVRIGSCEFAASLQGAHGQLTHVVLDGVGADRVRCGRTTIRRAERAFGEPERTAIQPASSGEVLTWRVSGDLVRITDVKGANRQVMVDLTTQGDQVATVR